MNEIREGASSGHRIREENHVCMGDWLRCEGAISCVGGSRASWGKKNIPYYTELGQGGEELLAGMG